MRTHELQDLFTRRGPFVTLSAEVGRTTEDARQQLDSRWTTIRHRLEGEGVPDAVVAELGDRLREQPGVGGAARRTLVAADGEILLDDLQAGSAVAPEVADVDVLPDLAPWLSLATRQHPFALAVVDREGADISFHPGLHDPDAEEREVHGADFYITKVAEGDWAQKQFQQTAENTWAANAREVADELRSGLRRHRSEVVLLAGDVRARQLVEEALDGVQVPIHQLEAGGRAAGASQESLWAEVTRVLAEVEAHAERDLLDRFHAGAGQAAGHASGVDEVLDALVKGQVEVLLLDPEAAAQQHVDPHDHPGLALPEGIERGPVRADRVLVAASVLTAAEIALLPRELADTTGVAALLRWDEAQQTSPGDTTDI